MRATAPRGICRIGHRRQRLEIVIEIVRGIAGEHNETRAHRRCLLDIVGEYGEGILVGFAENVRGAVRHGGIVEDDVVQIILIAMGMRGAVDQADVAFGGQRAMPPSTAKNGRFT